MSSRMRIITLKYKGTGEAVRLARRILTTFMFRSRSTSIELQAFADAARSTARWNVSEDSEQLHKTIIGGSMAQAAKAAAAQRGAVNPTVQTLMSVIQKRRSVRVYKSGKVSCPQLNTILEAARWAPSGANTQPWEFVVTRDRKKMKRVREIYSNEWKQRKLEDPVHYKGLKKDYVGDVSVL